ncbi:Putative teichuronic acid biosynthesis glycosyltransferase TuaG [Paenibacillus polymyxa E681]|uniref:glycosyltransferase n=1 Tax=Paenibacillus polymyxa TaxID=1406 RepID=UPI0001E31FAC|nr:glycosyltransferase [Paenibacillus polymyxa]ADM71623.1 glycosyl transferase [Paenibacillus polymyxa E681]QNV58644.1 Putative teichuronic acid biosynthesis glycosyltransferase TuaG [Paenibacillus polymyxa E681]QNV63479.1 Putative teichuronic acid biosynthesis glycosyltransferase TuaG [Paenibacillus polymyxa E681]
MRPKVTIVIPFYNCAYVDQALQSALEQTYGPLEIIVVDDGSTEHVDMLQAYLPYIHYLGKSNGGTASALNHGIRHASGEYIAWLSSDDTYHRDKINNQVSFMVENGAYISHTNFNFINQYSQVTSYQAAAVFPSMTEFYRFFQQGNPVNGCTVMFKKELFAHIGLFDELLPYTHDLDMWYRVMLAGYPFPFLNESLVNYRWHDEMGTKKHWPAVEREYNITQARYRDRFSLVLSGLSS